MTLTGKKESLILLVGDLLVFALALWLTLSVRYLMWPSAKLFWSHLAPFSVLFLVWTVVFFIFDLYRRQTILFTQDLPPLIFRAQLTNSLLAAVAFYFIPYFTQSGITPRTNLFIDLVITFFLIWLWRARMAFWLYRRRPVLVAFAVRGPEVAELQEAIRRRASSPLQLAGERADLIVFDTYGLLPSELNDFYQRLFRGFRFISIQHLYEEVFGRVPLSLINERWFLENVSAQSKPLYGLGKRLMDVVLTILLGAGALIVSPLIYLAIRLTDGRPIFFRQERLGRHQRVFEISKFRTMRDGRVTRVGGWLRRTRLDELPQLWNVLKGDLSFVGPRPERPDYAELYRREIPFYDARHLIAPGLSGWAQIYHENHPHFAPVALATREKLSYDLYYLKNRSFWLDLKIVLKTVRILFSRRGL